MPQVARLIGGAGTGKTTELLRIMDGVLERVHDPHLIGFVSFTRAARREASNRAADRFGCKPQKLETEGWFKTLHSVCYKQLGVGKELLADNADSVKWITESLDEEMAQSPGDSPDLSEAFRGRATDADKALAIWGQARNRLEPLEDAWRRADETDSGAPSLEDVEAIVRRYEQAKRLDGRVDFTDILARFAGWDLDIEGAEKCEPDGEVPAIPCWFFDEAQDNSALTDAVARRLISHEDCEYAYLTGDPFQCHPAGTMVRTVDGDKPIETLDPETDFIIAFNSRYGQFYGMAKKLKFERATRMVDSHDIWEITTEEGDVIEATGNHKWYCRYQPQPCVAVYLMQKGTRWRVGTVQMFATGKLKNEFRLGMRTQQEQAEKSWILKVFATNKEARAYEQVVSCRYGIPQTTFRPPSSKKRCYLDNWYIDTVFEELGDLTPEGEWCLKSHGRDPLFPLYTPVGGGKRSGLYGSEIQTCNLMPGINLIPKPNMKEDGRKTRVNGVIRTEEMRKRRLVHSRINWVKIVKVKRKPRGTLTQVYSLDVAVHHKYIANGYITCNSIYGFGGASPRHFMGWEVAKERVMPKSYRCPQSILAVGEELLSDCTDYWDRGIQPADHEGCVDACEMGGAIIAEIDPSDSWLLLARTNMLARKWGKLLDASGVPWTPTRGNGGWSAPNRNAAIRGLMAIQAGAPIDGAVWLEILKYAPSRHDGKQTLTVGTKSFFKGMNSDVAEDEWPFVLPDGLLDMGATPAFLEFVKSGRWQRWIPKAAEYVAAVGRWGEEAIQAANVRVGTIHSVKGSEADNVAVLTTLNEATTKGMRTDAGTDEELRVWYVAATRARKRLVWVRENTRYRKRVPV